MVAEGEKEEVKNSEVAEEENPIEKEEEEVNEVENIYKIERFEFSEEQLNKLEIKPIPFYPDELVW